MLKIAPDNLEVLTMVPLFQNQQMEWFLKNHSLSDGMVLEESLSKTVLQDLDRSHVLGDITLYQVLDQ